MPPPVAQKTPHRRSEIAAVGRLCDTRPCVRPPGPRPPPCPGAAAASVDARRAARRRDRRPTGCATSRCCRRARRDVEPWPAWAAPRRRGGVRRPAGSQRRGGTRRWPPTRRTPVGTSCSSTGTASGKSLAYQLPALTAIRDRPRPARPARRGACSTSRRPRRSPRTSSPRCQALGLDVRVTTHDGDSSREQRDWSRDFGEYVLTNPDMLHRSMLPGHAPVGAVLGIAAATSSSTSATTTAACSARTSPRCCAGCAGSPRCTAPSPTFVLASATVAEPEVPAGAARPACDVLAVTGDHSPRGAGHARRCGSRRSRRTSGENGAPVRRAASSETADLLADLVVEGVRTLAFVRSRRGVEQVATTAAALLAEVDPALAGQVASYRGGYLPEERRAIEADLRDGAAHRPGRDQRPRARHRRARPRRGGAGRLPRHPRCASGSRSAGPGRGGQDALGVLVARDDPLDTYLVHHPEALFGRPVEATVFDPDNPLRAAARTCAPPPTRVAAVAEADLALFGPRPRRVRRRAHRGRAAAPPRAGLVLDGPPAGLRPHRHPVGRRVARSSCVESGDRPGGRHRRRRRRARHRPRGRRLRPPRRDLAGGVARPRGAGRGDDARPIVDYSTTAREITDIAIARMRETRDWAGATPVARRGGGHPPGRVLPQAPLARRRGRSRRTPLDLPPRTLRTTAVWWTMPDGGPGRGRAGDGRPARRGARRRALRDRAAPAVRDLRPVGHRRGLDGAPSRHRPAHGLRLRRPPRRRRLLRARLPGRGGLAGRHPRDDRRLRLRRGLPVLHPVAQVRQPEQPARQGRCRAAARRPARGAPRTATSLPPW